MNFFSVATFNRIHKKKLKIGKFLNPGSDPVLNQWAIYVNLVTVSLYNIQPLSSDKKLPGIVCRPPHCCGLRRVWCCPAPPSWCTTACRHWCPRCPEQHSSTPLQPQEGIPDRQPGYVMALWSIALYWQILSGNMKILFIIFFCRIKFLLFFLLQLGRL